MILLIGFVAGLVIFIDFAVHTEKQIKMKG